MEQEYFLRQFAQRVAALRHKKGLSQEDLADKSGLHAVAITYIETGKRVPKLDTIYKLARGLDISVSDFFKQTNE